MSAWQSTPKNGQGIIQRVETGRARRLPALPPLTLKRRIGLSGAAAPTLLAHVLTAEAPTVAANPGAPGPIMVSSTSVAHVFPQLSADDFVIV
jgi:hypothetical protein